MININDVISEVSRRLELDKEVVSIICKHPFICVVDSMKSGDDIRDILFNKLLKFKLKRRFREDKTQKYKSK